MVKIKKQRRFVNPIMAEIIRKLHENGGYMSANEIANKTGYSGATVRKYLEILEKKTVILEPTSSGMIKALVNRKKQEKGKRGRIKRYILNYELIFEGEILSEWQ